MDLWETVTDFLIQNVTHSNFRVTDILTLANCLEIQLKPPRNSNSSQITFLIKDLLDESVKMGCSPLDFVKKMSQVRAFESLALVLKDQLLSDSISRINNALLMMQEQNREISR